MQKRMEQKTFACNKALFCDKILTAVELQYGCQFGKYIKIGHGEFGDVLFGRLKSRNLYVAIKALRRTKTDMYALLQEAFILQVASQSGHTPKYLGLAPTTMLGPHYLDWGIICEFVGDAQCQPFDFRRTLAEFQQMHTTNDSLLLWIFLSAKITSAVKRFHDMGMLLNDIKADNILLRPTYNGFEPVFIDFGLASIGEGITLALQVTEKNKANILKEYSHIAPEVLFGGETNIQSDIFSLGKALSLISDVYRIEAFQNIVSRCNLWNVKARPTCNELLHTFEWICKQLSHRMYRNVPV